jgi:PhzF family phenazine biosynthesis protein
MVATILERYGPLQGFYGRDINGLENMELEIYQIDAFASEVFKGNPAAVMPLTEWLPDETLQSLAMENNVAETAFFIPVENGYQLRWFTPTVEVDLCGHATLASAHVLFEHLAFKGDVIAFQTRSGELRVTRGKEGLTLDFPAAAMESTPVNSSICRALGSSGEAIEAVIASENPHAVVYVFASEREVANLAPNPSDLLAASDYSVIATAAGDHCDFVSRFFGPHVGINEDPVTGSAHCSLVPYWANRLASTTFKARQISTRGGDLYCELREGRVFMTGRGVTFMQGRVYLPD